MPKTIKGFRTKDYTFDQLEMIITAATEEAKTRRMEEDLAVLGKGLSPDERDAVQFMSQGLKHSRVTITQQVMAIRAAPRTVTLTARDGQALHLAQIALCYQGQPDVAILLSNGHVKRNTRAGGNAATGEWIIVPTPTGLPTPDMWRSQFPDALVTRLAQWPTPLPIEVLKIVLANGKANDLPQEVLVDWLASTAGGEIGKRVEKRVSNYVFGPAPTWTIRELVQEQLQAGREEGNVISMTYEYPQIQRGGDHRYHTEWFLPVAAAIDEFLITVNLLDPDLITSDVLDIPLTTILAQATARKQFIEEKGAKLRDAIALKYGWVKVPGSNYYGATFAKSEGYWLASLKLTKPKYDALSSRELENLKPYVAVTESGRIFIDGQYRCVVEAITANLPQSDQVSRRMLALSTSHRNAIYTLTNDREMLEDIFREARPDTVWEIRAAQTETETD